MTRSNVLDHTLAGVMLTYGKTHKGCQLGAKFCKRAKLGATYTRTIRSQGTAIVSQCGHTHSITMQCSGHTPMANKASFVAQGGSPIINQVYTTKGLRMRAQEATQSYTTWSTAIKC